MAQNAKTQERAVNKNKFAWGPPYNWMEHAWLRMCLFATKEGCVAVFQTFVSSHPSNHTIIHRQLHGFVASTAMVMWLRRLWRRVRCANRRITPAIEREGSARATRVEFEQMQWLSKLARRGHVTAARELCGRLHGRGVDVNERFLAPLVSCAARHNYTAVFQCVIETMWTQCRAPCVVQSATRALSLAAARGHLAIVRALCELPSQRGVDPTTWHMSQCRSMLRNAMEGQHADVARYLCEVASTRGTDLCANDNELIVLAASFGCLAVVRFLCDLSATRRVMRCGRVKSTHRVDPAANDNQPLLVAAANGCVAVVRYLCTLHPRRGVNPGARDNAALRYAASNGHTGVVRVLCDLPLARGVDPAAKSNATLRRAVKRGHEGVARYLCDLPLARGVDPGACGNDALISAAENGFTRLVRWLCELPVGRGVAPGARNNVAIRRAAMFGHAEVVRYLCALRLARGVDPSALGNAAMRMAIFGGHEEVVRCLSALPAVRGVNRRGMQQHSQLHTPLVQAARHGRVDLVRDLCTTSQEGEYFGAALRAAAWHGHLDAFQYLFRILIDRWSFGGMHVCETAAVNLAMERGHVAVVRCIHQKRQRDLGFDRCTVATSCDLGNVRFSAGNVTLVSTHENRMRYVLFMYRTIHEQVRHGGHVSVLRFLLEQVERLGNVRAGLQIGLLLRELALQHDQQHSQYTASHARALTYVVLEWPGADAWFRDHGSSWHACDLTTTSAAAQCPSWMQYMKPVYLRIAARVNLERVWKRRRTVLLLRGLRDAHRAAVVLP